MGSVAFEKGRAFGKDGGVGRGRKGCTHNSRGSGLWLAGLGRWLLVDVVQQGQAMRDKKQCLQGAEGLHKQSRASLWPMHWVCLAVKWRSMCVTAPGCLGVPLHCCWLLDWASLPSSVATEMGLLLGQDSCSSKRGPECTTLYVSEHVHLLLLLCRFVCVFRPQQDKPAPKAA
jgi:hypothetical protein